MSDRYPYTSPGKESPPFPWLPIQLVLKGQRIQAQGLLDSGATVNVMRYSLGLQLGASWERKSFRVQLTGNLANIEARGLLVDGLVGSFSAVQLAFAWAKTDQVPIILGQMNFFKHFQICFYGFDLAFEIEQNHT
jgi:hypothetical protein